MGHKARRVARYLKEGNLWKANCAKLSQNNRSKRARGKMRNAVGWSWRGPGGNAFKTYTRQFFVGQKTESIL